jgi:sphingosine-1-phosphate phosphatase 1
MQQMRNYFMSCVEADLHRVVGLQKLLGLHSKNPSKIITYLMYLGSALGDEAMFASFLPFLYWNIDHQLGRHEVLVWAVLLYVGQVIKDMFCLPRPSAPPVIQLEKHYSTEYGLPSTHAMTSIALSNYLFFYTYNYYHYPWIYGFIVVVSWVFLTCISRLYLGVHSVIDVYIGLALGFSLCFGAMQLCPSIDHYVLQHDNYYVPVTILGIIIGMLLLYPRNRKMWSSSFGDTTRVVGVACGCLLADWLLSDSSHVPFHVMRQEGEYNWKNSILMTTSWRLMLIRCIVGYAVMFIVKTISKKGMYTITPLLISKLGLGPAHIQNVENCNRYIIEIPCVFVTYTNIGFSAVYTGPLVMKLLQIA